MALQDPDNNGDFVWRLCSMKWQTVVVILLATLVVVCQSLLYPELSSQTTKSLKKARLRQYQAAMNKVLSSTLAGFLTGSYRSRFLLVGYQSIASRVFFESGVYLTNGVVFKGEKLGDFPARFAAFKWLISIFCGFHCWKTSRHSPPFQRVIVSVPLHDKPWRIFNIIIWQSLSTISKLAGYDYKNKKCSPN